MTKCAVTIIRTITRVIEVENTTVRDAEQDIIDYGLTEAWSDFPMRSESVNIETRKAKKIA